MEEITVKFLTQVPVQDLQEAENILQMRKGREYFVTVTLSDVTEMKNEYIRANEEAEACCRVNLHR